MNNLRLDTKAQYIRGVGPNMAKKLAKIDIRTVQDLLFYFPYRYNDLSKITSIDALRPMDIAIIKGKIVSINAFRSPRRRIHIITALLNDDTGSIEVIWFNQSYIERILNVGDEILVMGKADYSHSKGLKLVFQAKSYEKLEKNQHFVPEIVPVYSEKSGMHSKWIRTRIRLILPLVKKIIDPIPAKIKEQADLILSLIHI